MEGDEKSIKFLPLKHLSFQNHWVAKDWGAEAPQPPSCTVEVTLRGGARRGLGGYSPRQSMLVPRREVKSDFFGDFWHLSFPENHI